MAKDELDNIAGRISDADDLDEDMLDRLDDASSASDVDDQVPEVIRAVTTADDGERRRLINQIEEMEASARARVEKGLVEAVEDGGRQERIAAAQALAEVGGEASIEALEEAANEDDGEVNEAAADALESVRERTGATEDGKDGEDGGEREIGEELDGEGSGDEEPAETDDSEKKEPAGGGETAVKAPEALDGDFGVSDLVVLQMLESDDESVRGQAENAIRTAVETYPERVAEEVDEFGELLVDDYRDLRRYASHFVSEVSEHEPERLREHVPRILTALEDSVEEVQEDAERALSNVTEEFPKEVAEAVSREKREGSSGD